MFEKARQFMRPVKEDEVPALARHIYYSMKMLALATLLVTIPGLAVAMLGKGLPADYVIPWLGLLIVLTLGSLLAKGKMAVWSHGISLIIWMFFLLTLGIFPETFHLVEAVLCLPLGCAMATPLRPLFFLVQGVFLVVLRVFALVFWIGFNLEDFVWVLSSSVIVISVCMMGVQIFRRLLEELQMARRQLSAVDRLSMLGSHTGGIAHELNTPLSSALFQTHNLDALVEELGQSIGHQDVSDDDFREMHADMRQRLEGLRKGLTRATGFVRTLRQHTEQIQDQALVQFSVREQLEAITAQFHYRLESDKFVEIQGVSEDLKFYGDVDKFEQVLFNLIENALHIFESSGQGGVVKIKAMRDGGDVVIIVSDNGPGIPEAFKEKVFEPLFSTRPGEKGTGLGLSICRDLAEGVFGGSLVLLPQEQGACFEFRMCEQSSPQRPKPHNSSEFTPFGHVAKAQAALH